MMYNRFVLAAPVKPPSKEPNPDIEQYYKVNCKVVLDTGLDPDPYCLHNIPIHERLMAMGWPVYLLPYISEKNC